MATSKMSMLAKEGDPVLAHTKSTVSPQQLEQFVNFLPDGKRSPVDFANEMGRRNYWGASDMHKGAQDTQAAFAQDGRISPNTASQDYKSNRKNSMLWHQELLQDVLTNAKKMGMKNSQELMNNKDILLKNTRLGADDFNSIMHQYAGGGESRGDNFWRVTGGLYNDLQNREQVNNLSTALAKK